MDWGGINYEKREKEGSEGQRAKCNDTYKACHGEAVSSPANQIFFFITRFLKDYTVK